MKNATILFGIGFIMLCFFQSCNNNKPTNVGHKTTTVDTLGGKYKRIIHNYYGDTAIRTIHYKKNKTDWFEVVLHPTGEKYMEGWVKNNERDGKWYSWYVNGVMWSFGYYIDGKRNGETEVYYESGSLRIRQKYINDIPDGKWEFFYPNGKPQYEVVYDNGTKISEKSYK